MKNPQQFFIRLLLFLVCCLHFQKLFHQLWQGRLTCSILFTILCICINICLSHVNLRDSPSPIPSLFSSLLPILVHGSRQLIDLNKLSKWPHLAPRRVLPTHTHTRKHSCNVIAGARYTHTHAHNKCQAMRVRPAAHSIKRGASNQSSRQQAVTAAVDHRAVFIETNKGKRHTKKKPSKESYSRRKSYSKTPYENYEKKLQFPTANSAKR